MQKQNRKGGSTSQSASLLVVAVLLALCPASAFAYIDPGSGSLLLQIVMSAFFGALFLARNVLAKTATMFRRLLSGGKPEKTVPPD